jgi:hypothetical protein
MLHGNNTKKILIFIHCELCRIQVMVFYAYGYSIFVLRPLASAPKEIFHILDKFQCIITTSSNSQQQGMLVGCLWVDFSVPFLVITVTYLFPF